MMGINDLVRDIYLLRRGPSHQIFQDHTSTKDRAVSFETKSSTIHRREVLWFWWKSSILPLHLC